MKVLLVTDSSLHHFSGVVNKIKYMTRYMREAGHQCKLISTNDFFSVPIVPNEIRLAMPRQQTIRKIINDFSPDHIHLFTEGTLGLVVKKVCDRENLHYTTSFTTQFDLYLKRRYHIPMRVTQHLLNYFHSRASKIFVPTASMQASLAKYVHHPDITIIGRGVDHSIFHCRQAERPINQENPLCVYVGRIAKEKNLEDFLRIKSIRRKLVIGEGALKSKLQKAYPDAHFAGFQDHAAINDYFNQADIFVFPSQTDTFGQVMLEAMSAGLPVAAYPAIGPKDVILDGKTGILNEDLETAIHACKTLDRRDCITYAKQFCWKTITHQFLDNLVHA